MVKRIKIDAENEFFTVDLTAMGEFLTNIAKKRIRGNISVYNANIMSKMLEQDHKNG